MKNNIFSVLLLSLLIFPCGIFPMLRQFAKVAKTISVRGYSSRILDLVEDIMEGNGENELEILDELKNFGGIMEAPIASLKSSFLNEIAQEYAWSEYRPMLCGFNPYYGFLKRAYCPFSVSLLNNFNEMVEQDFFRVLDFYFEEMPEQIGEQGCFVVHIEEGDYEINIPFSLLYYATMLNKNVVLIKKLVEEYGEDVNFDLTKQVQAYELPSIRSIIECKTVLDWAKLHKNRRVVQYLEEQIAKTKKEALL